MNRILSIVAGTLCGAALLSGCGKSEEPKAPSAAVEEGPVPRSVSAEEVVRAQLRERGVSVGFNARKGTVIAVGSHEAEVKNPAAVNEAFRQVAFRKAFLEAAADIAMTIESSVESSRTAEEKGKTVGTRVMTMMGGKSLRGLLVISSVEAYDAAAKLHMVSLALEWSPKSESLATAIISNKYIQDGQKPGMRSLAAQIDALVAGNRLGALIFTDDAGDRWLLGMATVDDAMRRYMGRWFDAGSKVGVDDRLKVYALDGVSKMLDISVGYCRTSITAEGYSANEKLEGIVGCRPDETGAFAGDAESGEMLYSTLKLGDKFVTCASFDDNDQFRDECTARTGFCINPSNARLKWFVRKGKNLITGKEIEVLIGAIRCNDIAVGEKERQLNKISGN